MILGDMDDSSHRPRPARAADGSVALATPTPREPLRRAWALLGEHGLRVRALIAPRRWNPWPTRRCWRRSALAGCRAILVAGHAAMGADPRLALASGVALDRDRLRDLAGRPEPVCHAVARRSPLIADTDARTSAEGLQAAPWCWIPRARRARSWTRCLLARQGSSSAGDFLPLARATAGHALRRRPRRAHVLRRPRPHADPGRCRRAGAARGRNARAGATSRRAGPETRTRRQGRHLAHHARQP